MIRPLSLFALLLVVGCSEYGTEVPESLPTDAGHDAPRVEAGRVDAVPYPGLVTWPWLTHARVFVDGVVLGYTPRDCREVICRHNENTDMTTYKGAIWLVHRTAFSQVLGPDSALHVYKSIDNGRSFRETARIDAPTTRDIRDPAFYQVGDVLHMKALTRLPVASTRDSNVDTITVGMSTTDGVNWSPQQPIGPPGWSFWRIKENAGVYYSAAYQDGDMSVVLYTSKDGVAWTAGPPIYTISADTPLETELTFMPGGKLLALVRMDGNDTDLLGDVGPLRTKICWADPPYASFACPAEFDGERLDGPISFFADGRLFVVARKHLQMTGGKKRTDLFEITGDFDGGALQIHDWGSLPSAGDTSYAGIAAIDAKHFAVSWYSSDLTTDPVWVLGIIGASDIWLGEIDIGQLQ